MVPIASVGNGNELQADAPVLDGSACDSLEHSNPANMSHPSITYTSRLDALPDELLMAIFEQLFKEMLSGVRIFTKRRTFLSLCLVSKRIDRIARPYLFKKIYINDVCKLATLIRTVAVDQSHGAQIKRIDFDVSQFSEISRIALADRQELRDCYQCISEWLPAKSKGIQKKSDMIGILCYMLLSRAVNLSSLEMNIAIGERRAFGDGRAWDSYQWDMRHRDWPDPQTTLAFLNRVSEAIRSAADQEAEVFLPRLKELTLWSDCGSVAVEAIGHFLALPSLRTVESVEDDGNWYRLLPRPQLDLHDERAAHRNITTLKLSKTSACQYDIEDIAQLFPCLEALSVSQADDIDIDPGRLEDYVKRGNRKELSTVLGKLTALRTLRILLYPHPYITNNLYNDVTASLGPGNVLSLAQLPVLQHVEVSLYMFAHMGNLALGGNAAIPHKALPRSLKSLVLLAQLGCEDLPRHTEVCWDSLDSSLTFLEALRDDLSCFPHLQSVAYCFNNSSCGNPFSPAVQGRQDDEAAEDSVLSRLQVIRTSFSRRKVQFLLQEASERITIDLEALEE